jgi:hypothetical protein
VQGWGHSPHLPLPARQVGLWKSQAGAAEAEAGRGGCKAAAQELQGALEAAEARAGRLQRGQAEVRRRAEEAQEAVLRSLRRVRELEALARRVPGLQRGVRRQEAELSCSATGEPGGRVLQPMLCLLSLGSCICEIMLNLAAWSPPSIHPPSVHAQSPFVDRSWMCLLFALQCDPDNSYQ